jgi:hypothetical protein
MRLSCTNFIFIFCLLCVCCDGLPIFVSSGSLRAKRHGLRRRGHHLSARRASSRRSGTRGKRRNDTRRITQVKYRCYYIISFSLNAFWCCNVCFRVQTTHFTASPMLSILLQFFSSETLRYFCVQKKINS